MVNYNYSKVYKITNSIDDEIYIGSTTYQYLATRINSHRMMCKDISGRRDSKLYNKMRELGVENFKIELLEEVKCDCKEALLLKEQEYIDLLKPSLNMLRCKPRTQEEIKEYKNQWYRNKRIKEGKVKKTKKTPEEMREYKRQWALKKKELNIKYI